MHAFVVEGDDRDPPDPSAAALEVQPWPVDGVRAAQGEDGFVTRQCFVDLAQQCFTQVNYC